MLFPSYFNTLKPAYQIEQSLRFDGSSYLNRTPGSAGNRRTSTLSFWFKWASSGGEGVFLWANGRTKLAIDPGGNDRLSLDDYDGSFNLKKEATRSLRDPSAWYHVVVAMDTTNATADDRHRIYLNGQRITTFSTSTNSSQNFDTDWNNNVEHRIGYDGNFYFRGYIAEMHMLDGTAVTDAEDFGEYDDNGVWRPIEYTGDSYGTNGFYLKFDETATNGIGHDHSGQGNNFTASGFTTSGIGTDVMSDTPTKNWATLNPLSPSQSEAALSNGNIDCTWSNVSGHSRRSTIAMGSGKWYAEVTRGTSTLSIGLVDVDTRLLSWPGNSTYGSTGSYAYRTDNGNKYNNGNASSYGDSIATGDVIGIAYDADNGALYFSKNGTWQNSGDPTSGASATGAAFTGLGNQNWTIACGNAGGSTGGTATNFNFGQREFANRPGDTVGATDYFNTVTYTANNQSTKSVTGVGFQPDLVWLKTTGRNEHHYLYDAVRGVGNRISTSQTIAEVSGDNTFTSFDSDGFTLGSDGAGIANYQTDSMVAWCWKAGGSGSANNTGSINATVSANQDAGFSIVKYTGNSTSGATFAHGLGTAPSVVIVKNIDSGNQGWMIYHSGLGATKAIQFTANGELTDTAYWNDTAPSSTLVTLGNDNATNASGDDYVAYCWAEKTGVSKFGEYTGNGSSDGPVISCGFRPAMVMIKWYKDVSSSESWQIYDNKRAGNPNNTVLAPDANADDESPSDRYIQFTADGFQLRANGQQINRSGAKYIFMAFAGTFTAGDTYKSLNTSNLAAPTVKDGSKYFDTKLFTAGTTTVTGLSFQPDWVWAKNRDQSYNHRLIDVVRGIKNDLYSNNVSDEQTNQSDSLLTFTTDGFTHGKFGSADADDFVAWNWKAGGSVSADNNTDGSITSTVSASPTSGFSIVGWTGTGANGTVGHGLGVAPSVVLVKNRDDNTKGWPFQHTAAGNNYVEINNASSTFTGSAYFQNTAPTSSVFSVGTIGSTNGSGDEMIAYCFAEVEGYSKFGSYEGLNSDNENAFIYLGFTPAFVMIKNIDASANWIIHDTTRDTYNPSSTDLYPNTTGGEPSYEDNYMDFLSNGFKIRDTSGPSGNSNTYVYMAFASNPFGGKGAAPATAR